VPVNAADGIHVPGRDDTRLVVEGIDKQRSAMVAANIRKLRKPDQYRARAVRYQGEK